MRRVCFVDGNPHRNGCVISAVLDVSHPFDVHKVRRQECNTSTTTDLTQPHHAACHCSRNYWILYKMDSGEPRLVRRGYWSQSKRASFRFQPAVGVPQALIKVRFV